MELRLLQLIERFQGGTRRLELQRSGFWFLSVTIILGVAAVISGNLVLYFIESILLGGLIMSGVVSEQIVSSGHFELTRTNCTAREPTLDRVKIFNNSRFGIRFVEIGEWTQGRFNPIASCDWVPAMQSRTLQAEQVIENRGLHHWDSLAVATRFPFGFARKIRIFGGAGQRKVWPARDPRRQYQRRSALDQVTAHHPRSAPKPSEGEIRNVNYADDASAIVWTLSAKGIDPVTRVTRQSARSIRGRIDRRIRDRGAFEKSIIRTAEVFHEAFRSLEESDCLLEVQDQNGSRFVRGTVRALDELSLLAPEESP